MMLVLALPILIFVTAAHRYLALYAPSNVLIRRVRSSLPRWRTVGGLTVLAGGLILTMRAVEIAMVSGAPDWLNVVALILGWDAIKVAALTALTSLRCLLSGRRRSTFLDPI